jgi:hypothetical protein
MYTHINKQQTKRAALVTSYLVLSTVLYLVCAAWSHSNPEASRTLAMLSGLPMGPLFVMETGDMVSILPAYIFNAACIYSLLRGEK